MTPTSHRADQLLAGIVSGNALSALRDIQIDGLALDSRRVHPGYAFFALAGANAHGVTFAPNAIARGARLVLAETSTLPSLDRDALIAPSASSPVPVIWIDNLRNELGEIAARFFDRPSQKLHVIGVTGTNGKTSTVQMLGAALDLLEIPTATIGTLGAGLVGALSPGDRTTPEAIDVQTLFAGFVQAGATHVAMEVSSHALEEGRVNATSFEIAVFTNLTRDHLDYHANMADYAAAKAKLFAAPQLRVAILNSDDSFGRDLVASMPAGLETLRYSLYDTSVELHASAVHSSAQGLEFVLHTPWGEAQIASALLGVFNVANLLAVAGCLGALGIDFARIVAAIEALTPVAGRMNRLGGAPLPLVVVDYAHTPDALQQVLQNLRAHCAGKLTCVFGCGGDRDRGKRSEMAQIAQALADNVIVTDDNPRTEDGDAIVAEIMHGFTADSGFAIERDRAAAIALAICGARTGDIVLIAGKGHEAYQEVAGIKLALDDTEIARAVLHRLADSRA